MCAAVELICVSVWRTAYRYAMGPVNHA